MQARFLDELAADVGPDAAPVLDRLAPRARLARAQRNDIFYTQGSHPDAVFVVAHGAVLLEWSRLNGIVVGFRVAVGGDNFGVRSFCAGEARSATARAVRDTLVMVIPADALHGALEAEPRLWRPLARIVARDSGPQLAKIVRNARIPVRARLAYLLDYLEARLAGHVVSPVGQADSPLKQRDLAHLLDVADETLSRTLHALEADGLVATDDTGGLTIPDRQALAGVYVDYL